MNPSNIKKGLARFFGAPYDPRRLSHKFAAFVSALRISLINGENIPEIRPEVLAVLEKLLPFANHAK